MSHHATGNWKNQRKNPQAGISTGPHTPNRNQVRALLSGTAEEAVGFVLHHAENAAWLNVAKELESTRTSPRDLVMKAIRESLTANHA